MPVGPGRRLLARFRPWRAHLALAVVLLLVGSALQGVPVFLVRWTLDDVLFARNATALAWLGPTVVGLYALNGAVTVGRAVLTRSIAWRVVSDLREELFEHLLTLDVGWHGKIGSGERTSRVIGDVNTLQYAVNGVVTAIQKPVTLLVLTVSAFVMNAKLAVLALVLLPLAAIPIDRFGRWVRVASRDVLDASARLGGLVQETFTGIRVVQISGGEAERSRAHAALNRAHEKAQVRVLTAQLLPAPATELIAAIGVGIVIWVGGRDVVAGTMEPGELVAFLVALAVMNQPLRGLSEVSALLQRSLAAAETVFALLDRVPALAPAGSLVATAPSRIAFEGVTVDYGDGPVLRDVSFAVNAGQRVAVVGASGAGKTTLLSLLPRLRDPTSGRILWDGQDLSAFTLASLRAQVAVVTQEPFLFDDTVGANIRFGRPGATSDEVVRAAEAANAHGFICELPQGYDTRIEELGMRLSGGQRQRICIARALLRGAPVLLLDEATSNLDGASEAAVQEALERLMTGRTTFLVAHRLSTVRDADLLVVIAGGRVVETGTHAGLLAVDGEYRRLVSRQGETG